MRQNRQGFALFLTLGFVSVIVMLLMATITSTHGGNIFAQDYHAKTSAYYVAETGLAAVQQELEDSNGDTWTKGVWVDTPFETGQYRLSKESVNNLTGEVAMDGPNSSQLAPGTAFVKIEGRSRGQTAILECIIGYRSEDILATSIRASGKITFARDIIIRSRVSTDGLDSSKVDVISNSLHNSPNTINWVNPTDSSTNIIQGAARAASPNPNAITADLNGVADSLWVNQAPVPIENIPIKQIVNTKSSLSNSVPTLVGPAHPLNGEYYNSSDITVLGDLVLDDASLFINGDFTVLGSISGKGAIYVAGATKFAGDSKIVANEDGVALYSDGSVHLQGFSGTEWLDGLSATGGWSKVWSDTKASFKLLNDYLGAYDRDDNPDHFRAHDLPSTGALGTDKFYWGSDAGKVLSNLAMNAATSTRPNNPSTGIKMDNNLLYKVVTKIKNAPSGPTQSFMYDKFGFLRTPDRETPHSHPQLIGDDGSEPVTIFGALGVNYGDLPPEYNPSSPHYLNPSFDLYLRDAPQDHLRPDPYHRVIKDFVEGDRVGHLQHSGLQVEILLMAALLNGERFDASPFLVYEELGATGQKVYPALRKHTHWLDLYNFDRLGSSYFQGKIYTHGSIYTSNEITLVGSLTAVANPDNIKTKTFTNSIANQSFSPQPESVQLQSGDIYLGRGTEILHLDELRASPPLKFIPVGVRHWLR